MQQRPSGLKNFFKLYRPLTDSWQLYDNSNANQLSLIAYEAKGDRLIIQDNKIWSFLVETYDEK